MARNPIVINTATVAVFAWSMVRVAVGEAAENIPLASLPGLTVHQIVGGACPHGELSPGYCAPPVPDKEDGAA
ncbi:hypothetical protein ACFC0M_21025 [Streptomyces sp. NPDC056149]|uniref:hypothetical protein n=1 Tax=Streptomyces sp. NPDC056149 TaxID=3345728 RepID=UPI0035DB121F